MELQIRNRCLLLLLVAIFSSRVDCYGHKVNCTQADENCLTVQKCSYAMDFIKTNGIGSWKTQNFLYSNKCGYSDNEPRICCPYVKHHTTEETSIRQQGNLDQNSNTNQNRPTTSKPKYVSPLSMLPTDCGVDESDRIIGGELTALDEFPWMAILEYQSDQQSQTILGCGGTLISKRYVLTAAHCIINIPTNLRLRKVRLGEYDVRTDPDCSRDSVNGRRFCAYRMLSIPIEGWIVHENYNSPQMYRNDIALIRLSRDLLFNRFIKPICLPTTASTSSFYRSAGWGQIEFRPNSPIKLKVSLPYVEFNQCVTKYRTKNVFLGDGQMCAGGRAGQDTCKGDSGGPLMKQVQANSGPNRWVIDGVVSIGHSPCGLPGWPGVYTKVHNYVRWIVNNLRP